MRTPMWWMLARRAGVALTLLAAACSTPVGPWAGGPAGVASPSSYRESATAAPAACGGMTYSTQTACGSPWLNPR